MRYAVHENGMVVNIAEADEAFAQQQGWVPANDDTRIGDGWDGISYSTPPEVVDAARARVWEQIKAIRDQLQDEGGYMVSVGGAPKWFHSDVKSRTQQIGLVMMGANVPSVQWKTMDGSFVTMSPSLASAVFQAAATQDMALFSHAESLRAQVNASDAPESIGISAGWPATFGG
jgi:hypothetical protein